MVDFRLSELKFGTVTSVDGGKIVVKVSKLTVGNGSSESHAEIGAFVNCGSFHGDTICTITRVFIEQVETRTGDTYENKVVELAIVGSLNDEQKFTRGVSKHPPINCDAFFLNSEQVNYLLGIDKESNSALRYFKVGKWSMSGAGDAYLDLDKMLGRHVAIMGTTGSGKSSTVARIAQSILRDYPKPRLIFFDIHNEYKNAFSGPWEAKTNCVSWENFSLPYWFLDLEEFIGIYYPEAGGTQKMYIKEFIEELKRDQVSDEYIKRRVSVDSPIYFDMDELISRIIAKMKAETTDAKKDPYNKILLKLQAINNDNRFRFLKRGMDSKTSLVEFFNFLLGINPDVETYISVLDLSGLPAEIRTICVGVLTRLCFDYKYWDLDPESLPMALILEEAHSYIPDSSSSTYSLSLERVEKVAKEGRKYGLSLVVISQRPSNVSSTVLSQCGTFITLRLTNDLDQNKIKRLLPDILGEQADSLSTLRDGEALVTGDAVVLPGKIRFDKPDPRPRSNDVEFHKSWRTGPPDGYSVERLVRSWTTRERDHSQGMVPHED